MSLHNDIMNLPVHLEARLMFAERVIFKMGHKHALHAAAELALEVGAELRRVTGERDTAIGMLAAWCVDVDRKGSGWDEWDENYKDAMYRPNPLRALLDTAIAEEVTQRKLENSPD